MILTILPRSALEIAERVLDLSAVETFQISELSDPLREYSVWFHRESQMVLRAVTTVRLGMLMESAFEVRDSAGILRPQAKPQLRWHSSHAYFRRSQATDNLHEAYRNLFLAIEALLSEVYPWEFGLSETAWLKDALKYVAEGYNLNLSNFVRGAGGNPYRRFLK